MRGAKRTGTGYPFPRKGTPQPAPRVPGTFSLAQAAREPAYEPPKQIQGLETDTLKRRASARRAEATSASLGAEGRLGGPYLPEVPEDSLPARAGTRRHDWEGGVAGRQGSSPGMGVRDPRAPGS